jgi:hypothetical protein
MRVLHSLRLAAGVSAVRRAVSKQPALCCPLCQSPHVEVWPAAVELNVFICECGECQALFSVSPNPDRPTSVPVTKATPRGR